MQFGPVHLTSYLTCSACFSAGTVFFSHNNSARTVFFSQFQTNKRGQKVLDFCLSWLSAVSFSVLPSLWHFLSGECDAGNLVSMLNPSHDAAAKCQATWFWTITTHACMHGCDPRGRDDQVSSVQVAWCLEHHIRALESTASHHPARCFLLCLLTWEM